LILTVGIGVVAETLVIAHLFSTAGVAVNVIPIHAPSIRSTGDRADRVIPRVEAIDEIGAVVDEQTGGTEIRTDPFPSGSRLAALC
jgi:hypothetical protein